MWQQGAQPAAAAAAHGSSSSSPSRRWDDAHNLDLPLCRRLSFHRNIAIGSQPDAGRSDPVHHQLRSSAVASGRCSHDHDSGQHSTSIVCDREPDPIFMRVLLQLCKCTGLNQCVKEEAAAQQLDDMQTPSSLEDRHSHHIVVVVVVVVETALYCNWSQPKKRKTPDSPPADAIRCNIVITITTTTSSLPAHARPTTIKRKLANLESDIITLWKLVAAADPQSPCHRSTDHSSGLMADQESSKSSTEPEEVPGVAGAPPTDQSSPRDFFLRPAEKRAKLMQPRSGPSLYHHQPAEPSGSETQRPPAVQPRYQQADSDPELQLDLDMQVTTASTPPAHASGGGSGGWSGPGSGASRRRLAADHEETSSWLQLGLGGGSGSSKLPPGGSSRSNLVPQFPEALKQAAPLSKSPPSTPPSRRFSPPSQAPPVQHPTDLHTPSELTLPLSLASAPSPGQSPSFPPRERPSSQPGLVGFLPTFGATTAAASAPHGAFLTLASSPQPRDPQPQPLPGGTRPRGPGGYPLPWTASRDPHVPMTFPFPERGPGPGFPSYPGPSSSSSPYGVDFSHLISSFPGRPFHSRDTQGASPSGWRDPSHGTLRSLPSADTRGSPQQEQRTTRLPWLHEVPAGPSEPPRAGPFAAAAVPNVALQQEGQRAWERLLDRVGPATSHAQLPLPPPRLGESPEFQDVNLAYKRRLDQIHGSGAPPPWITKERGIGEPSGAGPSRRGPHQQRAGEGFFLHLAASGSLQAHDATPAPNPPNPGLWFRLQAAEPTGSEALDLLPPRGYIRVMDESMPVSMVRKYIAKKLGLADESEVDILCNGHEVQPSLSLQLVRDQLWQTGGAATQQPNASGGVALLPAADVLDSLMRHGELRENSDGTVTSPNDVIMVLTYRTRPPPSH